MKINNKSIKGIFVYSPNKEFEKGDLVIYDQMIYSVVGEVSNDVATPDLSSNYIPYYQKEVSTDYDDLLNYTASNSNRLVTLNLLRTALNHRLLSYSDRGTIRSTKDPNLPNSVGSQSISNLIKDLNNCCLLIDRGFSGLPSSIDTETKEDLLLRVYNTEGRKLVELVDFTDGVIYLKTFNLVDEDSTGESKLEEGNWLVSYTNSQSIGLVNKILATYDGKIKILNDLNEELRNSFRFKSIKINRNKSKVVLKNYKSSDKPDDIALDIDSIESLGEITVRITVKSSDQDSLLKSYELGFDVFDSNRGLSSNYTQNYWIDEGLAVAVIVNSSETSSGSKWSVEVRKSGSDGSYDPNFIIESVYFREYYKYE